MHEPAEQSTGAQQPPLAPRRGRLLLLTGLGVYLLDVLTKVLAVAVLSDREPLRLFGGLLYLTEARNRGAAFSFAEGATVLFTLVAVVVVLIILRASRRLRSLSWALALGLVLGGAAGNLTDRLLRDPGPLRGGVVDFLSVLDPYGAVWPIFNVADSAIVCGGLLAVVLTFRGVEFDGTRAVKAARR
ncbi:N/A [soil metagenome]